MVIPRITILSDSELEAIHSASLKVLEVVAKEKVREILATHKPESLSEAAESEKFYILKKSKEELETEKKR